MPRPLVRALCAVTVLATAVGALAGPATAAEPCVATVSGTVWDASAPQSRLPGLTIDLVDVRTGGVVTSTRTTEDGTYVVSLGCRWDEPVAVRASDPSGFYAPRFGFSSVTLAGATMIWPREAASYVTNHVAMTPPSRFVPVQPTRVIDTRSARTGRVGPATAEMFAIDGLPDDASAVVLNVTATEGTSPSSYVTASGDPAYRAPWVGGRPSTSSLNTSRGRDVANLVTVPVRSDGVVMLYNDSGHTHLVADLQGYYSTVEGAGFVPVAPVRALDTRRTSPVGPAEHRTLTLDSSSAAPAPAGAVAAVVTLTSTEATAPTSYVSAGPAGVTGIESSSVLNAYSGSDVPNLAIVPLGAGDAITLYNDQGRTHVVVDVVGWYVEDGGAYFQPVQAARASGSGRMSAGEVRTFPPTGGGFALPRSAVAVSLNLTTSAPTVSGYLTAYPSRTARPLASNANSRAGADIAAAVVVGVDPGFSVYNDAGSADVLVDVQGYFTPAG
ncbi:hypothetical protein [Cellulomonas sp. NS3]|uniref:hypothetical protein n=1 Tax=Cellulomonas sp. NS3 TaxID=2973977 RepID=UPI0021635242|nr:hypothetical protein [Cellulomonas sp. NS3]